MLLLGLTTVDSSSSWHIGLKYKSSPIAAAIRLPTIASVARRNLESLINRGSRRLIELFGLDADVLLARLALLPIFSHPGFVALTRSGIAAAEGERGDIGIRNIQLLIRVRGIDAHQRVGESGAGTAVEDVAFDFLATLQSDGNIAAIIER